MNASSLQNGRQGFTLIELLMVVVIIGILAAIAIPKYSAAREQAFRAAVMTDLKNIAHHQELYYNDNFTYSVNLETIGAETSGGVQIDITEATTSGWAATGYHLGLGDDDICGVFHGNAAAPDGSPATIEGVIACTF